MVLDALLVEGIALSDEAVGLAVGDRRATATDRTGRGRSFAVPTRTQGEAPLARGFEWRLFTCTIGGGGLRVTRRFMNRFSHRFSHRFAHRLGQRPGRWRRGEKPNSRDTSPQMGTLVPRRSRRTIADLTTRWDRVVIHLTRNSHRGRQ